MWISFPVNMKIFEGNSTQIRAGSVSVFYVGRPTGIQYFSPYFFSRYLYQCRYFKISDVAISVSVSVFFPSRCYFCHLCLFPIQPGFPNVITGCSARLFLYGFLQGICLHQVVIFDEKICVIKFIWTMIMSSWQHGYYLRGWDSRKTATSDLWEDKKFKKTRCIIVYIVAYW